MAQKFTEKDFHKEIAELAAELRRDIEAFSTGLDPSPEARLARRRRVLVDGDYRFFAYTYFPHHIRGEPSLFQAHLCDRFPKLLRQSGGTREWWVAPRGEAKSSLATKIGPVYIIVQGLLQRDDVRREIGWTGKIPPYLDYLILLGAETSLPTKLLEVVKTELTANAALALDFPEVCGKGAVWKVGEFVSKNGVKVEPFGAEQAIRGTFHGASRPKVLFGDDLITDAEAKSPTERENRWTWLEKAIDYLGPPDGSVKYVGVGTVLNKDDPISRAKKSIGHIVHHFRAIAQMPANMDLWQQCEELMLNADKGAVDQAAKDGHVISDDALPSYQFYAAHRAEMDEGAVISWPSVRTLYWLMRQRAKSPRAFATEMQGDPRTEDDKVFGHITFWVNKLAQWLMFGACDPSMGKGESSDPSAILVGGLDVVSRKLHVEYAEIKRRVPSKLAADLIAVQREYRCLAFGFENNNAYEWARQDLLRTGLRAGVPLPLVAVTATVAPEVRIDSLEPYITDRIAPSLLIHPALTALLAELDSWPEPQGAHHYDGLSALHILWMLAQTRGYTGNDGYVPARSGFRAEDQDDDMEREIDRWSSSSWR
ncbi:hypothetical protein LIG30_1475 [Burkholderia sp. lig30]|jgi:hypothetical protein|uniref:hypothetical protein n=1 Tax=Burkholderia sp. lig30 TaxID=1192124 RepID=UPI000461EE4D|nr:hypothetical protein [Burkholderia sp. lig30]KDB09503.1 hypothetical protein LIG30_1475 [Burkholderia sp. lig30]